MEPTSFLEKTNGHISRNDSLNQEGQEQARQGAKVTKKIDGINLVPQKDKKADKPLAKLIQKRESTNQVRKAAATDTAEIKATRGCYEQAYAKKGRHLEKRHASRDDSLNQEDRKDGLTQQQ